MKSGDVTVSEVKFIIIYILNYVIYNIKFVLYFRLYNLKNKKNISNCKMLYFKLLNSIVLDAPTMATHTNHMPMQKKEDALPLQGRHEFAIDACNCFESHFLYFNFFIYIF